MKIGKKNETSKRTDKKKLQSVKFREKMQKQTGLT